MSGGEKISDIEISLPMIARFMLVRNSSAETLDAMLIEIAFKETDMTVKHALADRGNNPMQVWKILAADKDPRVHNFLRENKNIPKEILDKLPIVRIKEQ